MEVPTRIGVSGFSYPAWKGKFYPKEAKSDELLASYAQRLGSVEINSSFYGAPRPETVTGWAEKAPEEFVFSFKAPRLITHITKLGPTSAKTATRFSDSLEALGPRRGAILFQLPPFLRKNEELLDGFLKETGSIPRRVFEFRDETWFVEPVQEILRKHEVGFCIAETEDLEPRFDITSSFAYFRLRKDSYDAKAIDSWAAQIGKLSQGVKETYVYLRHDETGENAVLAQRLAGKLKG